MISRKAYTLRLMITGDALRVFPAIELDARIDAQSVEAIAVFVRRTVFVVLANILALFH